MLLDCQQKMSKEELICRLCLKLASNETVAVDEVIRQMLECMLQVQLDSVIFENTVICKDCVEAIERLYAFKSICMDNQDLILLSNVQENRTDIDLRSIYKAKTNLTLDEDANVCRLCMKPSKEASLISIEALTIDAEFVEMWAKYMTEFNLGITINPKVCSNCKKNIQCYFKFVLDVGDTLENSEGLPKTCTVKVEHLTDASTSSSCHDTFEIESVNSLSYSDGLNNQICAVKQEPSSTEYNHVPKRETELCIKEEKDDHSCICGICTKCIARQHVSSSDGTEILLADEPITEKRHKCTICDYRTKTKSNLTKHMDVHKAKSELTVFQCLHCPYATHWRCALYRHLKRTHTSSEPFSCTQCSYTTTYENYFKRHMKKHADVDGSRKIHECTLCDYKAKFKCWLDRHIVFNHADKSQLQMYKCVHCEYQTYWKYHMKRHNRLHSDRDAAQKYACTSCPFVSDNIFTLRRHNLVHKSSTEVVMHECSVCGFKTKHTSSLSKHMGSHKQRSELKMYKCEECSYESRKKDLVTRHALVHKNRAETRMYRCTLCTFETKHRGSLKGHALTHRNDKETRL